MPIKNVASIITALLWKITHTINFDGVSHSEDILWAPKQKCAVCMYGHGRRINGEFTVGALPVYHSTRTRSRAVLHCNTIRFSLITWAQLKCVVWGLWLFGGGRCGAHNIKFIVVIAERAPSKKRRRKHLARKNIPENYLCLLRSGMPLALKCIRWHGIYDITPNKL